MPEPDWKTGEPERLPGNAEDVACPHCLHANAENAAFCERCGAPIGMVANVDPIQRIYAEGFGIRSAVDGPPKRIILIGIWLLFLPLAGISLAGIIRFAASGMSAAGFSLTMPVEFVIAVAILYFATRNYIRKSRAARKEEQ